MSITKKFEFLEMPLNQLHNKQNKGWIYIADIYAFLLVFLAIFRFSDGKWGKRVFKKRHLVNDIGNYNCTFVRFCNLKLSEYLH
jgi:hypothetical protein